MRTASVCLLTVAFAACSNDKKSAANDEYTAEPFDTTYQLNADSLAALDNVGADGTIHFATTPAQLAGIQSGTVIISNRSAIAPNGLLRFVRTVTPDGAGLTLGTVQAPLQVAFRSLHVKTAKRTAALGAAPTTQSAPGVSAEALTAQSGGGGGTLNLGFVAFDGDGNSETTDDQVTVNGELGASFDYTFGIDMAWEKVIALPADVVVCMAAPGCEPSDIMPSVSLGFNVDASADASAGLVGSPFLSFEKDVTIADQVFEPFSVSVLEFVPSVVVIGHLTGDASSQFSLSAGTHAGFKGGITFSTSDGLTTQPPTPTATFDAPNAQVALDAHSRVSVEAKLLLLMYGAVGPYASLEPYAEVSADSTATPCWSVDTGLEAHFGFTVAINAGELGYVNIAGLDLPVNVADATIASGSCALPPGYSTLPKGAGPDAQHIASPTIAPYAYYYQAQSYDPAGNPPYPGAAPYTDTFRTYSARTIDGSVVVGSNDARGLTKIRDDGSVAWAAQFQYPEDTFDGNDQYRQVSGVANLGDASILVATDPYGFLRLNQDGTIVSAITYDISADVPIDSPDGSIGDNTRFYDVVRDGAGGVYVVGTQTDTGDSSRSRLWVMRMDVNGNVLWSHRFGDGATEGFFPTTTSLSANGIGIAGNGVPSVDTHPTFVLNLDADGNVIYARRYTVDCPDGIAGDAPIPYGSTFTRAGDLVLVGEASSYGINFRMRVDSGGQSQGFLADHRTDLLAASFNWTDIAELSTGCFITVGYQENDQFTQQLEVGRLDSGLTEGTVKNRKPLYFSPASPNLILTDDGGAWVFDSYVSVYDPPSEPDGYEAGGVFVAKYPVNTMDMTWLAGTYADIEVDYEAESCTLNDSAWNVTITDFVATAHSSEVKRSAFDQAPTKLSQ